MAAIDAITTLLESGDHVVVTDNTYGGTFRLFDKVLTRYKLEFSYVDTSQPDLVERGDAAEHEDAVRRDADQPGAAPDRHRRRRPEIARRHEAAPGGRQHFRQPRPAAAASSSAPTS